MKNQENSLNKDNQIQEQKIRLVKTQEKLKHVQCSINLLEEDIKHESDAINKNNTDIQKKQLDVSNKFLPKQEENQQILTLLNNKLEDISKKVTEAMDKFEEAVSRFDDAEAKITKSIESLPNKNDDKELAELINNATNSLTKISDLYLARRAEASQKFTDLMNEEAGLQNKIKATKEEFQELQTTYEKDLDAIKKLHHQRTEEAENNIKKASDVIKQLKGDLKNLDALIKFDEIGLKLDNGNNVEVCDINFVTEYVNSNCCANYKYIGNHTPNDIEKNVTGDYNLNFCDKHC